MKKSNLKGYLKLLSNIAKINPKAALYLLTLSKQDKVDTNFNPSPSLSSVLLWRNTSQGQEYWSELSCILKGEKTPEPDVSENMPLKFTMQSLGEMFPAKSRTRAVTGYIPMEFFIANEKDIRDAMKASLCSRRTVYRGPRYNESKSFTARKDATHVVIY